MNTNDLLFALEKKRMASAFKKEHIYLIRHLEYVEEGKSCNFQLKRDEELLNGSYTISFVPELPGVLVMDIVNQKESKYKLRTYSDSSKMEVLYDAETQTSEKPYFNRREVGAN